MNWRGGKGAGRRKCANGRGGKGAGWWVEGGGVGVGGRVGGVCAGSSLIIMHPGCGLAYPSLSLYIYI